MSGTSIRPTSLPRLMWVCGVQTWVCGNAGNSWSATRCPSGLLFRLANDPSIACRALAHDPHPDARRTRRRSGGQLIAKAGVHHVFPAMEAPWEGEALVVGRRGGLRTHVSAKKGPFGRFGMGILVWTSGRRLSSSRLESARRCPMCGSGAAGPLVPERQGAFGALRCSARMVEVPNPYEFLG